ncbi:hypothetical protein GCM10026982_20290 [Nocardiopsis aegyptia]
MHPLVRSQPFRDVQPNGKDCPKTPRYSTGNDEAAAPGEGTAASCGRGAYRRTANWNCPAQ